MSKTGILLIGGLIAAAFGYQILERVPSDALNVALGVACGVGASIPVLLGLIIALMRQREQNNVSAEWRDPEPEPERFVQRPTPQHVPQNASQQPQIIVIAPPQGQFGQGQFPQGFSLPAQWMNQFYPSAQENIETVESRDWRIIGEE